MIKPQQLSKEEYMSMRMYSYQSFLEGIKPAIYVYNEQQLSQDEQAELDTYPSISVYPPLGDKGVMFFCNEELKESFLQEIRQVDLSSTDASAILGAFLGFPPKAVDFFTNRDYHIRQHRATYCIGVNYAGIQFAAHIDDLEDNINWLWDTYENKLPVWVSIKLLEKKSYHPEHFWIRYRNETDVLEAREFLEEIMKRNQQYLNQR